MTATLFRLVLASTLVLAVTAPALAQPKMPAVVIGEAKITPDWKHPFPISLTWWRLDAQIAPRAPTPT